MAYITPKTNWNESYDPSIQDMNRIEGNIEYLNDEIISESATLDAKIDSDIATANDAIDTLDARITSDVATVNSSITSLLNDPKTFNGLKTFNGGIQVNTIQAIGSNGVTISDVNLKNGVITGLVWGA